MKNTKKYQPFPSIRLSNRQWPSRSIQKAPQWCSVDLRDGNQALITPMSIPEKIEFFKALLNMGFKQIEVGFPSASQTEYDFTRKLIDNKLIPDDVVIQVLVQARKHLIEKTFESLEGARGPIVHLYNSTSENQRLMVFGKTEQEIIDIALQEYDVSKKKSPEQASRFNSSTLRKALPERNWISPLESATRSYANGILPRIIK